MKFTEYKSLLFPRVGSPKIGNVNNGSGEEEPLTLLESVAGGGGIIVCSIIVCNFTADVVRFNMQREKIQTFIGTTPERRFTIHSVTNMLIEPLESVDIIERFGFDLQLGSETAEDDSVITDRLLCFSNGPSQIFDVEVTYQLLNELV